MDTPMPPKLPPRPGRTKVFKALYPYTAQQPDELSFQEGDILYVIDETCNPQGWWQARCNGKLGLIPSNYVGEQIESIDYPLHEAARRGNLAFLNECLHNKVVPTSLDKSGSTPLYWAAHSGSIDCVKALVPYAKTTVNSQNKLGDTALHAAAWKGHRNVVELLLDHGGNARIKNNENKTPLDLATCPETAALLKRVTSSGNEVDMQDYQGSDVDSD